LKAGDKATAARWAAAWPSIADTICFKIGRHFAIKNVLRQTVGRIGGSHIAFRRLYGRQPLNDFTTDTTFRIRRNAHV
jgi:hypothetical protein